MRSTSSVARWASCALVLVVTMPAAFADSPAKGKKSLATCTSFDQQDKDENTVELSITNSCSVPVDCTITWRLTCAPESKKRRTVHAGAAKLVLADAASQTAEASAAVCKDDSWSIDQVQWSCTPNKD